MNPDLYLSGSDLRQALQTIFTARGINLKENEFFVHAGSSKDITPDFRQSSKSDLYTAVDMSVVRAFGIRNLEKAKGGNLVGIVLILPAELFKTLKSEGAVEIQGIDDWPGKVEFVFLPSAASATNSCGTWIYLDEAFFLKS